MSTAYNLLCMVYHFPDRTENKDGPSSVVKVEEKGIIQKLKDVFWKSDDDKAEQQQTDQSRDKMS